DGERDRFERWAQIEGWKPKRGGTIHGGSVQRADSGTGIRERPLDVCEHGSVGPQEIRSRGEHGRRAQRGRSAAGRESSIVATGRPGPDRSGVIGDYWAWGSSII